MQGPTVRQLSHSVYFFAILHPDLVISDLARYFNQSIYLNVIFGFL